MRRLLANPATYRFFQDFVASRKRPSHYEFLRHICRTFAREHGRAPVVLDIGCGEGRLANDLGDVAKYIGTDLSQRYIDFAEKKYGEKGRFFQCDVGSDDLDIQSFGADIILMVGVLHHIDDATARRLIEKIKTDAPQAIFISIDGVFLEGQNILGKVLLHLDRGQFVRDIEGYRSISGGMDYLVHNFLRIPCEYALFFRNIDLKAALKEFMAATRSAAPS